MVMTRIATSFFVLASLARAAHAQAPDSSLFAAARKAEVEAEEAIRKYAEFKPDGPTSLQECDEHIGTWCIYYDPPGRPRHKEPSKVTKARQEAIVALKKAFDVAPGRTATVYPLVRLLVRDERPDEAVDVARAYLGARDSADAHMVLGYALHYARRTEEALQEFGKWLAASPPHVRDKVDDIGWLLPPHMASKYRMTAPKLWRYADALYFTPGNETLADHYGRHAYNMMMAVRPTPSNAEPWNAAQDQIIVRFGPAIATTRFFNGRGPGVAQSFLEHWDNTEHTYFPPDYDRVIEMRAPVDTLWPTDTLVGRSGHAPPTIRFMRSLQHQASVFPGVNTLVVAGGTKTDKPSAGKAMAGALFLMDANLNVVARSDAVVKAMGDSLVFVGQMPVHADARFFSAEVYDGETRFAARAR